jgi:hypothetical protein
MENSWLDIELPVLITMESSIALLFNGLSIGVLQVGRFYVGDQQVAGAYSIRA